MVVQIRATADSELDTLRSHRVQAVANAMVCGSRREAPASFRWSLRDNTAQKDVTLPASTKDVLELAANLLTAGNKYTIIVVGRLEKTGVNAHPTASASVTFVAKRRVPRCVFQGGERREVSNADSLVVGLDVSKLNTAVGTDGNFVEIPAIRWACAVASDNSACPAALATALAAQTAKITVPASVGIPAGTYSITATVGDGDDACTTKQTVVVVAAIAKQCQGQIFGEPSEEALLSGRHIVLYARTSDDSATVAWTVNGVAQATSGRQFTLDRSTGGPRFDIKMTTSYQNGCSTSASLTITVPTPVTGTCTVSIADSSDDTAMVALRTPLTVSSFWSGMDSTRLRFQHSVWSAGGANAKPTPATLSPVSSELSSITVTAPNVIGTTPVRTKFTVSAHLVNTGAVVATALCYADITPPTRADTDELRNAGKERIATALANKDTQSLTNMASNLATQARGESDPSTKTSLQKDSITAAKNLGDVLTDSDGELSRAQRSTLAKSLKSVVDSANPAAATSRHALAMSNAAGERLAHLDAATQSTIASTLFKAANPPRGGTNAQNSLDSDDDSDDVLDVLSNLGVKDRNVHDTAVNLARTVSAQTTLGGETKKIGEKISLAGKSFPGVSSAVKLSGNDCHVSLPDNHPFSDQTNTYSLSTTEMRDNHINPTDAGKPANQVRSSRIVDVVLQSNGVKRDVKNLATPIRISIKIDKRATTTAAPRTTAAPSRPKCMYHDDTTNTWTDRGVVTVGHDLATGEVHCDTIHLSAYAIFDDDAAAAQNNAGTNTAPEATTQTRAYIIAGCVAGAALLIGATMFIRARRNQGTGQGPTSLDPAMNHYLFAAPQVNAYEMSHHGAAPGEFSNL